MATFFLQDIYTITGIGLVPVGRVEDGILRVGMKSNIGGKIFEVRSIEMNHKQLKEANPGDNIGINVRLTSDNGFFKKIFGNTNEEYNILKNYKGKSIEFI